MTETTFIPAVLRRHLTELEYLWGQRQNALRDPHRSLLEFAELETRIEVQREGVIASGAAAVPVLERRLESDEPMSVFAAAYALLFLDGVGGATRVCDLFLRAGPPRLAGLRLALCHAPIHTIAARLDEAFRSVPAPVAVAAGEALAFHGALRDGGEQVRRFISDESAEVRQGGWRLIACLGLTVPAEDHAAALQDEPAVRRAALQARAWCREPGVLRVCRESAASPAPEKLDALELLAVLGGLEDLPLMQAIGRSHTLGPDRYRLLGSYGHPELVDLLLEGMRADDAASVRAAAAAFEKLSGGDGSSSGLASSYWESVRHEHVGKSRLYRGMDLNRGLGREAFAKLDMQTRWETCLRAKYTGMWDGSPLSLEVFPQLRS